MDLDSLGTEMYYDCQYRVRGGGSFKVVRSAAQLLCFLLTANEIKENENVTRDSINFPTEIPTQGTRKKTKTMCQSANWKRGTCYGRCLMRLLLV